MDNTILDVVIGLMLIYATLALLVTSLQEFFAGTLLRGRVGVMHTLLEEAVGHDAALKDRLLANPLVFALSVGEKAKSGVFFPTGPSALPPDVFARALLMEVDTSQSHRHPSELHATPQQFLDALKEKGLHLVGGEERKIVSVLRGLVVGREADWGGFEAAISAWFQHIGDRSEGWFKRRSTWWTVGISLTLSVAINADSMNIAQVLSSDGALRSGLADLAERVVAQREAAPASPATAASAAQRPEVLVSARLMYAYNRLHPMYFQDDEIARFGHKLLPVSKACAVGWLSSDDGGPQLARVQKQYISDSNTWLEVIPALKAVIEDAIVGYQPRGVGGTLKETKPSTSSSAASSDNGADTGSVETLRRARSCLIQISAWVDAAAPASKDPAVQRAMQEAAAALEDSKRALTELLRQQRVPLRLAQMFSADPKTYAECLRDATSRDALRVCMEPALGDLSRLPLGWGGANVHAQFCQVMTAKKDERLEDLKADSGLFHLCVGEADARPELGLPAMKLDAQPVGTWVAWAFGIMVTTFFISLGAPFWFDLLGKLVKMRSAGRTRDQEDNARKAAGTLPLLPPQAGGGGAAAAAPAVLPPPAPFTPAANRFEDQLTKREIIALQQRLGVIPISGVLDAATRLKLRSVQSAQGLGETDTLTPASYLALVGRPALANEVAASVTGIRPRLRQLHPQVPALARNLMPILGFPGRIPADERSFSDDLRALTVLYRYKMENATPEAERTVFKLARDNAAALDELDEALMNEILSSRNVPPNCARDASAPWLDWAIGELGQVENSASSRQASNPRICEYLDALPAPLGDQGDRTAWCGAFVCWVMKKHNDAPIGGVLPPVPKVPESAASWITWGQQRNPVLPQRGDVVVVKSPGTSSGHHVGFCLAVDATHVWLLGGNQMDGSRVCLSCFVLAGVVTASFG
ncbi:hypothetical protein AZOA_18190 [Azoarcus sp. Aa7]|nr:hypothetical protein [Azoarcus sp. Aa7]